MLRPIFAAVVFGALVASAVAQQAPGTAPATGRPVSTGSLQQIVPGHYLYMSYMSAAPGRMSFNSEIARGATEDQAVAAVKLEQSRNLATYECQREILVRRMYQELKGTLP